MRDKSQNEPLKKVHSALIPLRRVTVSEPFFREVFNHFPQLKASPAYQTLFWYLLFGGRHDEDTERLLLCADVISAIEGRSPQNSHAEAFLKEFRAKILLPNGCEMQWSGWHIKKCRQLVRLNLDGFKEALSHEQCGDWDLDGLVFLDGTRFNSKRQRQLRLEYREQANRVPTFCDDATNIRAYLNDLPPNLFTGLMNRNFRAALNVALEIDDDNVREAQLRILRHIKSQPQPFYFPSGRGNTVRLCTSESIPNLKSSVRLALTRGWHDADLRCSQLAICGHLWKIKEVTEFLEGGGNIWSHLCDSILLPQESRKRAKPTIKKAVYSICYGMDERSVKGLAALRFVIAKLDKNFALRLMDVPIVKTLLAARQARLVEVERQGGATNGYDEWRPITNERKPRDILAEISQSWEMRLIAPAFDLARSCNEFVIGLFQHDGFSVRFAKQSEPRRIETTKHRIQQAVESHAQQLGIPTRLEWVPIPPIVTKEYNVIINKPNVNLSIPSGCPLN